MANAIAGRIDFGRANSEPTFRFTQRLITLVASVQHLGERIKSMVKHTILAVESFLLHEQFIVPGIGRNNMKHGFQFDLSQLLASAMCRFAVGH